MGGQRTGGFPQYRLLSADYLRHLRDESGKTRGHGSRPEEMPGLAAAAGQGGAPPALPGADARRRHDYFLGRRNNRGDTLPGDTGLLRPGRGSQRQQYLARRRRRRHHEEKRGGVRRRDGARLRRHTRRGAHAGDSEKHRRRITEKEPLRLYGRRAQGRTVLRAAGQSRRPDRLGHPARLFRAGCQRYGLRHRLRHPGRHLLRRHRTGRLP